MKHTKNTTDVAAGVERALRVSRAGLRRALGRVRDGLDPAPEVVREPDADTAAAERAELVLLWCGLIDRLEETRGAVASAASNGVLDYDEAQRGLNVMETAIDELNIARPRLAK